MRTKPLARKKLGIEPLEPRLMLDGNGLADIAQPRVVPDLADSSYLEGLSAADLATPDQADPAAVASAINQFALDLYARLQDTEGNLFFSPFSISTALAMTCAGARGETASQMAEVLRFMLGQDAMHPAFGSLVDALNAAGEAGDYELSVANALWGQAGFPFRDAFLDLVASCYGGGFRELDFKADPEAARQTINAWVEQQTRERIQDLIPEGVLDAMTRLVLTNAIYFKAQWAQEFDPARTWVDPFTLASGEQIDAEMMHANGKYRYMEADGFQVLEMPYVGDRLSMVVLLPTEGAGASGLEASSIPENLDQWLGGLRQREVVLSFPKFKMTTEFELAGVLKAMGMTDAFSDTRADFSGMAKLSGLTIANVIHKAFVEVNEEGTEAAAATGVIVGITSIYEPPPPVYFTADHPFHFLIRDNQSGSILFMGRLMAPAECTDSEVPSDPVLGPLDPQPPWPDPSPPPDDPPQVPPEDPGPGTPEEPPVVLPPSDGPAPGDPPAPEEPLPPVETPPIEIPPVEIDPIEIPPVEIGPVEIPPVEIAPIDTPPIEIGPVEIPPVEIAPIDTPPDEPAPVEAAPVEVALADIAWTVSPDAMAILLYLEHEGLCLGAMSASQRGPSEGAGGTITSKVAFISTVYEDHLAVTKQGQFGSDLEGQLRSVYQDHVFADPDSLSATSGHEALTDDPLGDFDSEALASDLAEEAIEAGDEQWLLQDSAVDEVFE
jgi:serpin B